MIHPLFKMLVAHPTAITDHIEAYAELASTELSATASQLRTRALKVVTAVVCATAALLFAGVAAMLWAVTPAAALHAPWVLWLVPGLPAIAAGWCWISATATDAPAAFSVLRSQVREDIAMVREAST